MLEPNIACGSSTVHALPKFMSNMPRDQRRSASIHLQPYPAIKLPSSSLGMPAKRNHVGGVNPKKQIPRSIPRMLSSMRSSVDIKLEMATTVEQTRAPPARRQWVKLASNRSTT